MHTRTAAALLTSIAALLAISSGITPSFASTAKTWTVTRQVITGP